MKRRLCILLMILLSMNLFGQGNSEKPDVKLSVKQVWTTKQVFEVPESVLYDSQRKLIYVSNISGDPGDKDGRGFISSLNADGSIINLKWITGLNAPKGMGIYNGKLYVTDITEVVEIDIKKGSVINRFSSSSAQFLNDLTVDQAGIVYVSDNRANRVFRLSAGKLETWLSGPGLKSPNGLFAEEDGLLIGTDGIVFLAGYHSKKMTPFITDTGFIDGLVQDGNGNYLISNFSGAVHLVYPGEKKIKILDTTEKNIQAADIDYIINDNLLLIPTFYDNRVTAYQIITE